MPIITPSLTIPTQSIQNNVATINGTTTRPGNVPPMVPLLILNGLQPQQNNINNLEKTHSNVNIGSSGNTGELCCKILKIIFKDSRPLAIKFYLNFTCR